MFLLPEDLALLLAGERTVMPGSTSLKVSTIGLLASKCLSLETHYCSSHTTLQPRARMTSSSSQFLTCLNTSRETPQLETWSSLALTPTALTSLAPEGKTPGTTSLNCLNWSQSIQDIQPSIITISRHIPLSTLLLSLRT